MKVTGWIFALGVWGWLCSAVVLSCRFNVRDVGFVDLENEPYHLFGFSRRESPAELAGHFSEPVQRALRDCNVVLEPIDIDQQLDHPTRRNVPAHFSELLFAAVLVSPDGQALPVMLCRTAAEFDQTLASAFNEIASSPMRQEIREAVVSSFGAVLLVEGSDGELNRQAQAAIATASEQIRGQLGLLPKTIAQPPALVTLTAKALGQEKVLLWSLGLDQAVQPAPRAAVIYGRARWIGPLIKAQEITEEKVEGILSIIGAD